MDGDGRYSVVSQDRPTNNHRKTNPAPAWQKNENTSKLCVCVFMRWDCLGGDLENLKQRLAFGFDISLCFFFSKMAAGDTRSNKTQSFQTIGIFVARADQQHNLYKTEIHGRTQ